jgi:hypothetical protein
MRRWSFAIVDMVVVVVRDHCLRGAVIPIAAS